MLVRAPLVAAVLLVAGMLVPRAAAAQASRVVDIPTRPGVTQRFLYVAPDAPKAAAILFSGGQGNVGINADGTIAHPDNFLVRTRAQFARAGIAVAVIDPPSDRAKPPYLGGFRQSAQHVADVRAVIAWLRAQSSLPVWLIGTSRGTQSAAFVATQLPAPAAGGPDGLVLTSTILIGSNAGDRPVPEMPLGRIAVPVLVVHHEQDGCPLCPFVNVGALIGEFTAAPRKQAIGVHGGRSVGDPCEAFAYHGYNGIEDLVVTTIANWVLGS